MKKFKKIFIIVADSMGIGASPDAADYKNGDGTDAGSDTFGALCRSGCLRAEVLASLGIGEIDGVADCYPRCARPIGAHGRLREASAGKDTVTGHWEMAGVISEKAMPTFPDGFPAKIIEKLCAAFGRGWLCNKPYSGTAVINDYGREHLETGKLILYTSADSVLQIAAHESLITPEELYGYCRAAREILSGEYAVGRVIARPFTGEYPDFSRTANRRDFALEPPQATLCDAVEQAGMDVIGIGKIGDIFAHRGITEELHTVSNSDGIEKTFEVMKRDFHGLCFVNLVDFDMKYGHRRDVSGYTGAVNELDRALGDMIKTLDSDSCLVVTADHGCDPSHIGTDHTREYIPCLIYGEGILPVKLGERSSFADIGKTCAELLGVPSSALSGTGFASLITG